MKPRRDAALSTSRRHLLLGLSLGAALTVGPARLVRSAAIAALRNDPFTLGVASGYPTESGMVLWTRLAPEPHLASGGMPPAPVTVKWEVATDERFRKVVAQGVTDALPDWAHSVHVEVNGLAAGRPYWYRFTAGDARSPVGRTATAPPRDATNTRVRVAVANCQHYEQGFYAAYRHICHDEPDLILHLGDYIYERGWGINRVRTHGNPECRTLDDYRVRHALYRSDRDLQTAHAAAPWLLAWDDHEVENDYAGDVSENDDPREVFLARRAAAYRAYYEHMPLPRQCRPVGPDMRIYGDLRYGSLLNLLMLDERQYRSRQACARPGKRGSRTVADCPEMVSAERTKLGTAQEAWLETRLAASDARWNILAQGTVMAYIDEQPGPGEKFWTDAWSGYPAAQQRFIDTLVRTQARNPVVLSGDIHAFLASDLHRTAGDSDTAVVASEFTATSVTSQSASQSFFDERKAGNPAVRFANGEYRGYLRLEIERDVLRADLIAMDDVRRVDSGRKLLASFAVEDKRAGIQTV